MLIDIQSNFNQLFTQSSVGTMCRLLYFLVEARKKKLIILWLSKNFAQFRREMKQLMQNCCMVSERARIKTPGFDFE